MTYHEMVVIVLPALLLLNIALVAWSLAERFWSWRGRHACDHLWEETVNGRRGHRRCLLCSKRETLHERRRPRAGEPKHEWR